jgi:hypothetical protein
MVVDGPLGTSARVVARLGAARRIIAACDYLLEETSAETDLLYGKLEAVRRGELSPGDFRFPYRCALFLALAGAGAVATIGLGGAPVYVGLALVNSTGLGVLGWEANGCPRVLPEIGRDRR